MHGALCKTWHAAQQPPPLCRTFSVTSSLTPYLSTASFWPPNVCTVRMADSRSCAIAPASAYLRAHNSRGEAKAANAWAYKYAHLGALTLNVGHQLHHDGSPDSHQGRHGTQHQGELPALDESQDEATNEGGADTRSSHEGSGSHATAQRGTAGLTSSGCPSQALSPCHQ